MVGPSRSQRRLHVYPPRPPPAHQLIARWREVRVEGESMHEHVSEQVGLFEWFEGKGEVADLIDWQ